MLLQWFWSSDNNLTRYVRSWSRDLLGWRSVMSIPYVGERKNKNIYTTRNNNIQYTNILIYAMNNENLFLNNWTIRYTFMWYLRIVCYFYKVHILQTASIYIFLHCIMLGENTLERLELGYKTREMETKAEILFEFENFYKKLNSNVVWNIFMMWVPKYT